MHYGSVSPTVVVSPGSATISRSTSRASRVPSYSVLRVVASEGQSPNVSISRRDVSVSGSSRSGSQLDVGQVEEPPARRHDSQSLLSVPLSRGLSRSSSRASSAEIRAAQSGSVMGPNSILPSVSIQPSRHPLALQDTPPGQTLRETDGNFSLDPDTRNRSPRERNAHRPRAQGTDRTASERSEQSSTVPPFVPPPLREPQPSRSSSRSSVPLAVIRGPSRPMAAPHDMPRNVDQSLSGSVRPGPSSDVVATPSTSTVTEPPLALMGPDAPKSPRTTSSHYYPPSLPPAPQILSKQPSAVSPPSILVEPRSGSSSPGGRGSQGSHTPTVRDQIQSDHAVLPEIPTSLLCCCARFESHRPPAWGQTRPGDGVPGKPDGPQPQVGFMDRIVYVCCCRCCCGD